jgi:predicted lipoprotein with Yx(FWY)xxD motif
MASSGSARTAGVIRWPVLVILPAVGLLGAGCASGNGNAASTSTSRPGIGATSTTASGGQPAANGTSAFYEVKTGTVSRLGTVLVNGQGLTLYMFVPDHQQGQSTCYTTCASAWPPLRLPTGVHVPVAGGEAQPALLGTTSRRDGGLQVTYNGWPLYLWAGDSQPGQATGQGLDNLGGYWYVLSPKGLVIKTKA